MKNKIFGTLVALSAALSVVACNKSGGGGSPSRPAANNATATPPQFQQERQPVEKDDQVYLDHSLAQPERRPVAPSTPIVAAEPEKTTLATMPGNECSEAYRDNTAEWFPGLPNPPSTEPVFTDFITGKSGIRYTDARQDGLFAREVDRANALPDAIKKVSQDFAKQIRDVHVAVDKQSGAVSVQISYQYRMGKSVIELRGQINGGQTQLVQVPAIGKTDAHTVFAGWLTCADSDHGCKNITLRLDLRNSQINKIVRSVFIVHRWGDAHITIAENDRKKFANLGNRDHQAFARYLSNTANNACLNILADVAAGRRQLPQCAIQHLQQECAFQKVKRPSARAFGLRTWAVAYGRGAFELTLTNNDYDGVGDYAVKSTRGTTRIRGPLAHASVTPPSPMWKHPLLVSGDLRTAGSAYLITNDGGGNLNLQFDFAGQPEENMRVSVTSELPNTRYSQSVAEAAQQMPQVSAHDVASDEPIAEPQDLN